MTHEDGVTLLFPDRRTNGAFPVTDDHGHPVACITAAWASGHFTVTTPDGAPLCTAVTSRWRLSGTWDVTGSDGSRLLTVTVKPLRNSATAYLARGGQFAVRGSPWRRDFTVLDELGRAVLTATPRTSAVSARQYDYAVYQPSPGPLRLLEVVAIVQVWRIVKESDVAVLAARARPRRPDERHTPGVGQRRTLRAPRVGALPLWVAQAQRPGPCETERPACAHGRVGR